MQSRYYNPEIGRFINADGLTGTGQGLLSNNMYTYCANNPVGNYDPSGQAFLKNAWKLIKLWLHGDGTSQHYINNNSLVRKIKRNAKMERLVSDAEEQFKAGVDSGEWNHGIVTFTADDNLDLYLAARTCSYSISIVTETRTKGHWFWKRDQQKLRVSVTVYDLYDFTPQKWDSVGNYLNNFAYITHVLFDIGKDYWWYATYTYETPWENIS